MPPTIPFRDWPAPPLVVPTASPINSVALARLLHHHPNRPWVVWLCVGSRRGFDGGETCPQIRLPPCRNSKSATDTPAAVAAVGAHFVKEVIARRFAAFGPLCPPMRIEFCPIVRFCPVGTTPKRSYTGKPSIRVTSNHSKEQGGLPSYNEGIDAAQHSLSYVTIVEMCAAGLEFGTEACFSKVDCKHAFRNQDRAPECLWSQFYHWELTDLQIVEITTALAHDLSELELQELRCRLASGNFCDRSSSFGSRSSCKLFEGLACAIQHLSQRLCDQQIGVGQTVSLHLLDDQGTIARTKQEAVAAFGIITELYKEVGLPLSEDEKQGCGLEAGEWLGWWLDFRQQVLKVTPEKVASYRADLKRIMEEKRSTRDQLLQIAGRLSFVCLVLPAAKSLVNVFWALAYKMPTPNAWPSRTSYPGGGNCANTRTAKAHASLFYDYLDPERGTNAWPFKLLVGDDKWDRDQEWPHPPGRSGRPFLVTDASGVDGAGIMGGSYDAVTWCSCKLWTEEDRVDRQELNGETSSTFLEVLTVARGLLTLLANDPSIHSLTVEVYCDSMGTRDVFKRGRSRAPMINAVLIAVATALIKRRIDVRVRWRRREDVWITLSDALSHCPPPTDAQAMVSNLTGAPCEFYTLKSLPDTA